jgi:hypothetical protein
MANSVNSINAVLYHNFNYDFVADFTRAGHALADPDDRAPVSAGQDGARVHRLGPPAFERREHICLAFSSRLNVRE